MVQRPYLDQASGNRTPRFEIPEYQISTHSVLNHFCVGLNRGAVASGETLAKEMLNTKNTFHVVGHVGVVQVRMMLGARSLDRYCASGDLRTHEGTFFGFDNMWPSEKSHGQSPAIEQGPWDKNVVGLFHRQ